MTPPLRFFALGLVSLTLMGCEGEKKSSSPPPNFGTSLNCGPGSFSSPQNPAGYVVRDLSPTLQQVNFTDGSSGYLSSRFTAFNLPPNTVSFAIQIYGNEVLFRSLQNLQRNFIFRGFWSRQPVNPRFRSDMGRCSSNILIPKKPGVTALGGNWLYEIQSDTPNPQVKIVYRTSPLHASVPNCPGNDCPTFDVVPYLTGPTYSSANIQPALNEFVRIYRQHGIHMNLEPVQSIPDARFRAVRADFDNATTVNLVSRSAAGKINLFFVEDLIDNEGDQGFVLLGIAAGIPGSLGLQGRYNGVLMGLEAHATGRVLNASQLGSTTAHEVGHFLGLFHTTEKTGLRFDILADTPQCPFSFASPNSQEVTVQNCLGRGGQNLMFWQNSSRHTQTTLSADQIEVIQHSPIAR